ncbi:hypothetical protein Zmor_009125 [Zophobas morio]|uniref:Uncharacterized protein n=1 Tax=Zophobas morio TaxID=2755281 RepID=A0AA38IJX6_9CUCU|nr:hypothetical protein Zmor_009125 [Zophobas morio]
MTKLKHDKTIYDLISRAKHPEDKMRLFIIFFICSPHMGDSDLKRYEAALSEAGCDLSPIHYIKRWKSYAKMASSSNHLEGAGTKTVNVFQIGVGSNRGRHAIVFVVGGGNYIEYQNLVDYAKQKTSAGSTKRITYGSSTLANAKQFLKQLSLLGQEIV